MELKRIRERQEEKKSTSFFSVSCTSVDGRKNGNVMYGEGECNKRVGGVYGDEEVRRGGYLRRKGAQNREYWC